MVKERRLNEDDNILCTQEVRIDVIIETLNESNAQCTIVLFHRLQ